MLTWYKNLGSIYITRRKKIQVKSQSKNQGGKKGPPPLQQPLFFFANMNRFFYFSRKCVYSNCLSTKQLDCFEKNVKSGSKMEFCPKSTPFLPIFTDFWATWDWPFIFGRFWPNFLFLPEICLFVLSFYETTRFFWKNAKTGSKMEFCPKQNPLFLPIFSFS